MPLLCGVWAMDIGKVMSFRPEVVVLGMLQLIPTLAETRVGRMNRMAAKIEAVFIVMVDRRNLVVNW